MADDDPSEIHFHWEPPSENLIHRGGVDIKWMALRAVPKIFHYEARPIVHVDIILISS